MLVTKNNQFKAYLVTYGYTDENGTEHDIHTDLVNNIDDACILYRQYEKERCDEIGHWCCLDAVIISVNVDMDGDLYADIDEIDCRALYKED